MNTLLKIGALVAVQAALVAGAVAPQLSARLSGESFLLRVQPVDPIDPFRGAYVALDYPDLQLPEDERDDVSDAERGTVYVTLEQDGEVWVAGEWTRERPGAGPYLACDDRDWWVRCGIESWFVPQDEATAMERTLADGAIAEVRVDDRGHAAIVDVRAGTD